MKKILILLSLLWFVLNTVSAQIDPSIPIPPDLQALKGEIKLLKTERLPDGTIVIRYVNKQGRTIQRRTHPSKPGEKQEWDEANPPDRPDKSNPGAAVGRVPTDGSRAAAGGVPDTIKGARLGEGVPVATPGGVKPGSTTPGGVFPGGTPLGGTPPDKSKPSKPSSVLDDVKKGAEGILPDNAKPDKPASALGEAGKAAKKIAEDILKAISNLLVIKATGTGRTIGNIANITLKNNNDFPVGILPQTFFIPSDGKYQSYVARIPDGTGILPESTYDSPGADPNVITIPPGGTVLIPVTGVCTDVYTPPVPPGESMPPVSKWVPVGGLPPGVVVDAEPPGGTNPPEMSDPPSTVPKPADPPGVSDPPSTEPTPMDPPGESTTPTGITLIPIVNTVPVPKFDPTDIPQITTTSGYTPVVSTDHDIIITWPGTNIPVGGTLDPRPDPNAFAPVVVEVLEAIEDAVDVIQQHDSFPTPFANNPPGERDAIIQQTFWIYTSTLTGRPYTKDDFTANTYRQFENNTGKLVTALKPEQKEQVDEGITDFWNAFQATGVTAKVISAESPGIEIEMPTATVQSDQVEQPSMADNDGDDVANPETEDEEEFKCECPEAVLYSIEVTHGKQTEKLGAWPNGKPPEWTVRFDNLKWSDTLKIKAYNVIVDCLCADASCEVFWALYFLDSSKNCFEWNSEPKENAVWIKLKPRNKKDKTIVAKFVISIQCTADYCQPCNCDQEGQIILKDSRAKR